MSADYERYVAGCHAMQSGVAFMMEKDPSETAPKHLRVGMNSAQVTNAAMCKLLLQKGIITMAEYDKAIADEMDAEVKRYQDAIEAITGAKITLA